MPASRLGRLAPLVAGLVHSILMAVAFPPVGLWAAVFLAPFPLIWAAVHAARLPPPPRPAGRIRRVAQRMLGAPALAALGVLPLWAFEMAWVTDVTLAGFVPLTLILSAFTGLLVALLIGTRRAFPRLPLGTTVPIIWAGAEFFRGEIAFDGYPWLLTAHPTLDAPLVPSVAACLGAYGVGLVIAAANAAVADAVFLGGRTSAAVRLAAIALLVGVCVLVDRSSWPGTDRAIRVAIVQTNVPQDNKTYWSVRQRLTDFTRFEELTRRAAAATPKPDLIVWPETMFPGLALGEHALTAERDAGLSYPADRFEGRAEPLPTTYFADKLIALQRELEVPMLIGALGLDGLRFSPRQDGGVITDRDAEHNSVFLIADGRVAPTRYDKIHLTPFGEVMPYISAWPWLEQRFLALGAPGMSFDLDAGRRPVHFEVPTAAGPVRIATPICFEATKPRGCRDLVHGDSGVPADLLINLTNDGWFGWWDGGRWQHLQISRWRAAELRVPVLRAANTGVSAAIDARGRVLKTGVDGGAEARVDGVLAADIPLTHGATIYRRTGDVVGWAAFIGSVSLALAAIIQSRRARRADKREPQEKPTP